MARDYDRARVIFSVDVGVGISIALEGIIKLFRERTSILCYVIDVSADMIKRGRGNFLIVQWYYGRAEDL
ncbi:ubiquinone/menaquinone biosynthesis C-methylase UbiE [Bartonella fuyuanensis]|uniref:Ubiquinone/menaquinone biosynthesis C-methylase UbiE n=1 Tax=Bartonella fuyuanensis TaxID=1460968 RepID=A0A840E140_9HYPH|nr:hypothetical protein [Bartonella fuyuanensis]MBB4076667.1 ubiquinone/menaquinone biosynthesis C-methylase UbiE [Bartonella fuyuanensis]